MTDTPAVVLVNLGTPEEPTPAAVRPYLREFLSDRRVVETHPALWRPVLEGIILRVRPKASAAKYKTVWLPEGSPLLHYTIRQGQELQERLGDRADVFIAMRYGKPALRQVLQQIRESGKTDRVLVVPLYPQYSASSAGTVIDEAARWTLRARNQLELRTIRSFETLPSYIEALAEALEKSWAENGRPDPAAGDKVVLSFHSIPKAMHDKGDPYRSECEETARLLRERVGMDEDAMLLCFQSVFGPAEWIGPATIDSMESLAQAGTKRVDVICPGFMSDCLETLEEIAQLNAETFLEKGGRDFHYVPWGNDSPGAVQAITDVVETGLAGWA